MTDDEKWETFVSPRYAVGSRVHIARCDYDEMEHRIGQRGTVQGYKYCTGDYPFIRVTFQNGESGDFYESELETE